MAAPGLFPPGVERGSGDNDSEATQEPEESGRVSTHHTTQRHVQTAREIAVTPYTGTILAKNRAV